VTSPPPEELPLPAPGTTPGAAATKQESANRPLPGAISTDELKEFSDQPDRVQKMIQAGLELSKRGLTYQYGSADPDKGGMDCSGSIYYLLRAQGYKNVPRDASGQYVWARKNGKFYAVVSKKADSFEFSDLKPGDLLFWAGTYKVDKDPPVTHSMIYLGRHAKTGDPVMWGASDGRSYEGKARWGVGVFDFKMPRVGENASPSDFLGYARIPDPAEATQPADEGKAD
jgi:cell wall-associated NlpC family hydrolase